MKPNKESDPKQILNLANGTKATAVKNKIARDRVIASHTLAVRFEEVAPDPDFVTTSRVEQRDLGAVVETPSIKARTFFWLPSVIQVEHRDAQY